MTKVYYSEAAVNTIYDLLSGGRFERGLDAGGFWDAIAAYGGPRRRPRESAGALGEAMTVIRKVWSGERNLRFEGAHDRLAGAQAGPVPAHPDRYLAGRGPVPAARRPP